MKEDTCHKCGVEMWREGRIDDDIKLCHPCYLVIYERGGSQCLSVECAVGLSQGGL
jgi:hypothetical protein